MTDHSVCIQVPNCQGELYAIAHSWIPRLADKGARRGDKIREGGAKNFNVKIK